MTSSSRHELPRRSALIGGLGGAGVLALAACGSSGGTTRDATPRAGDPPVSSAGGTDPAPLAELASIRVGEAVSATLAGKPVLVARPTASTAACFSAICTHQGCTVAPAGKRLQCPCHGSVYDATTGAVISGPAPRALDRVRVKVEHGEVVPDA